MKTAEFNTLMQEIRAATEGKHLTGYLYGKHYQMNEPEREGAQAFSLAICTDGTRLDYFRLYALADNKFGGRSYRDSKVWRSDCHTLTNKQRAAIVDFFKSIKDNR